MLLWCGKTVCVRFASEAAFVLGAGCFGMFSIRLALVTHLVTDEGQS
jgi:hypothetical protein